MIKDNVFRGKSLYLQSNMEDKYLNRFRYALCNGQILCIDDVTKEIRKTSTFTCIGCGHEMSAALGDVREHYYRHKNSESCSHETYLHNLAKKRIKELFDSQDSFLIHYKAINSCDLYGVCKLHRCENSFWQKIDLKDFFDTCEIEKVCGNFRPDVLLTHSEFPNRRLFIEIHVKNPCSPEKIGSGIKIIEIDVFNEDTIIYPFHEQLPNVHFYNFKFNRKIVPSTKLERFTCIQKADKINVHSLSFIDCTEFSNHLDNTRFEITIVKPNEDIPTLMLGYAQCVVRGIRVRYCHFCINVHVCRRVIETQIIKDDKTNEEKTVQRIVSPNSIDFDRLWETAKQCNYFKSNVRECHDLIKKYGSHNFIVLERNSTKK